MKYKAGDRVRILDKSGEFGFTSEMRKLIGNMYTIEHGYNYIHNINYYSIIEDEVAIWFWREDWLAPAIVDNSLNRKLYPNYIREGGYLVRPNIDVDRNDNA